MTLEQIEQALICYRDAPGAVGIIGGEPLVYPDIRGLCGLCSKHIPRHRLHLFTAIKPAHLWRQYEPLLRRTFGTIDINEHREENNACTNHHPSTMAVAEACDPDTTERLIDACWVPRVWCGTVNHKGGFFCEVAAALDVLLDGLGGWPIVPRWWDRSQTQCKEQRDRYCHKCGMCLPQQPQPIGDTKERFTPKLHQLFIDRGLRSMENTEVVELKLSAEDAAKTAENWKPWGYYPNEQTRPVAKSPPQPPQYTLFLTTCISPAVPPGLKLTDPVTRLSEVIAALWRWSESPLIESIVVADANGFKPKSMDVLGVPKLREWWAWDLSGISRPYGRGRAESALTRNTLDASKIIGDCYFKCTGRLAVDNFSAVASSITQSTEIASGWWPSSGRHLFDTRLYYSTRNAFAKHLAPLEERINCCGRPSPSIIEKVWKAVVPSHHTPFTVAPRYIGRGAGDLYVYSRYYIPQRINAAKALAQQLLNQ